MSQPPVPDDSTRLHTRPWALGLVFVGGTLGTATREAVALAWRDVHGIPVAIWVVNITGAFLLGLLLEALLRLGPQPRRRHRLRLLIGTGFLGGFTTYSAVAVDSASLIGAGRWGAGMGYAVATVVVGALATVAGIALGALLTRRRHGDSA